MTKEKIEDNNEFITDDIYTENDDGIIDEIGKSSLPRKIKDRLRHLAEGSQFSRKQAMKFMSWTELDLLRREEERLNIYGLFEACCKNCSRYWLDPSPLLKKLDGVIELYAGKGPDRKRVLSPFIHLLTECAVNRINPASFLQYIIEPRLSDDKDWRRWPERHIRPLTLIFNILHKLKQSSPFNRAVLGTERNKISRDVVLVKYGGKPLSLYSEIDLEDPDLCSTYLNAWQNLSLDNAFTIFFMKSNLLHFMYLFSGKISFQHLIAILEQMPQIEEGFEENFPTEKFNLKISAIPLNLYDYDINKSIDIRRAKGFKNTDFTRELRAYMKIIAALLKTGAGIYLCGFFARKLTRVKDPETADSFAALIDAIEDDGGKRIYTWHAESLIKKPKIHHQQYIEYIIECGGCDPSYPSPDDIFHHAHESFFSFNDYSSMLKDLGITLDDMSASTGRPLESLKVRNITPGMVLITYKDKYPDKVPLIDRAIDDICEGGDRLWDFRFINDLDSLGKGLHFPIMKRVVRGLQITSFTGPKSSSFEELYNLYKGDNYDRFYDARVSFSLSTKDRDAASPDRMVQHEVRRQVDLNVFHELWECLNHEGGTFDAVVRHMNRIAMGIREAAEKIESEILTSEQNRKSPEADKGGDKKTAGMKHSLKTLKKQMDEIENLIQYFQKTTDSGLKFLIALMAAGYKGKTGDDFTKDIVCAILNRYSHVEQISERIDFLKRDVPIELLTLDQAERIVNTIEVAALEVTRDAENILEKHKSRHGELLELLKPFITLRSKRLDTDAVDASFKSIVSYNRLTALLSKWIGIVEQNNLIEKTTDHFSILTSREPVDAYYGDMGGICLSTHPDLVKNPSFINCRLISEKDKAIAGIAILYYSPYILGDYKKGRSGFWLAFSINPLSSLLNRLNEKNKLALYLHFRMIFEKVSIQSGLPVVLAGIGTSGIVSNCMNYSNEIVSLEKKWGSVETFSAVGLDLFYLEEDYAHGLVIIDPDDEKTIKSYK